MLTKKLNHCQWRRDVTNSWCRDEIRGPRPQILLVTQSALLSQTRRSHGAGTFSHHGELDHLADIGAVLVVGVEEDAVEEASVGARVVVGDVEQVDGRVLDVRAPLTSVPINPIHEVFVLDDRALLIVGVDLMPQRQSGEAAQFEALAHDRLRVRVRLCTGPAAGCCKQKALATLTPTPQHILKGREVGAQLTQHAAEESEEQELRCCHVSRMLEERFYVTRSLKNQYRAPAVERLLLKL
ncbi:hypothetical protein EYF80_036571 [Liparis tanakae]|uniref:Uncharacterized protein n=1 Tax=Liparis tanakae TaxID=230148 RepID=A0A4Z2GIT9_9TELE|nr:hypothetical protein EYF80_036571 [Liparis tanakae]